MIVVDASVVTDYLLGRRSVVSAMEEALTRDVRIHAPEVVDLEVMNAIRRMTRRHVVAEVIAAAAINDLSDLPLVRWPHGWLRARIWELRHELSAYDASYLALAETASEPRLLTADAGLAARARRSLGEAAVRELTD